MLNVGIGRRRSFFYLSQTFFQRKKKRLDSKSNTTRAQDNIIEANAPARDNLSELKYSKSIFVSKLFHLPGSQREAAAANDEKKVKKKKIHNIVERREWRVLDSALENIDEILIGSVIMSKCRNQ